MKKLGLLSLILVFFISCGGKNDSGSEGNGYAYSYSGTLFSPNGQQLALQSNQHGTIMLTAASSDVQSKLDNHYYSQQGATVTVASDQPLSNTNTNQYSSGVYPSFQVKAVYSGNTVGTSGTGNNNQVNRICGTIYASFDGFSITYVFNTRAGQIPVSGGDQQTSSILGQMPPNATANNVCATKVGQQGNTTLIQNLSQQ